MGKYIVLALPYSHLNEETTIGAGGLNCCVRDGNRWDPTALSTRTIYLQTQSKIHIFDRREYGFATAQIAFNDLSEAHYTRTIIKNVQSPVRTTSLNTLLCVHVWPIKPVIFRRANGETQS